MTSNTIAAFFDLDGTLYTGHIWKAITRHHWIHRKKLPFLLAFLVTHLGPWPLVKAGLLDKEGYFIRWGENGAIAVGPDLLSESGCHRCATHHDLDPVPQASLDNGLDIFRIG